MLRLIPAASATMVLPPRLSSDAVAPTITRRWRSLTWGRTVSKYQTSSSDVASTWRVYNARINLWWTLTSFKRAGHDPAAKVVWMSWLFFFPG